MLPAHWCSPAAFAHGRLSGGSDWLAVWGAQELHGAADALLRSYSASCAAQGSRTLSDLTTVWRAASGHSSPGGSASDSPTPAAVCTQAGTSGAQTPSAAMAVGSQDASSAVPGAYGPRLPLLPSWSSGGLQLGQPTPQSSTQGQFYGYSPINSSSSHRYHTPIAFQPNRFVLSPAIQCCYHHRAVMAAHHPPVAYPRGMGVQLKALNNPAVVSIRGFESI